ncbi:sensor histidine kinase [Bacillus tuaregi]|uniref:sensor histidine kinase n=1 Tax=Bacillus tuaregi TaxID=1816695 RepID=UPI0008F8E0F6|nr:HAMP domain-containing sensor histidine kinase [Bacillus tuaregi]
MSFHRKLFLALALSILGVSLVFILMTHITVKKTLEVGIDETRGQEMKLLTQELTAYFLQNNDSWNDLQQIDVLKTIQQDDPELLVLDKEQQIVYQKGDSSHQLIRNLGIKGDIRIAKDRVGEFYYYDPEIANFTKVMIGIPISVVFILTVTGSILILISLIIAYRLSKWLAAPLQKLLPVIDRLGKGELGIQVQTETKDEYGKIAEAFNHMSKELEHAETLRKNLTADVAHELRTPLTIISGKLDYLQQQGKMIQPETLLPLQDELIRLNQLVEDLRILSFAEAGKLTLDKVPTDMSELASQLLFALEPLAEEKSIHLELDKHTNDTTVLIDANRMKQVLLNLLMNALRYTPENGHISIRLLKEDNQTLKVIVEDTGVGIEPEHLPHLFDRFYRTDQARSRDSGGTGLGLAIAKQYIQSHGGNIEVESKLNVGTMFIIQLPL